MSKQSEAKKQMGYTKLLPMCCFCVEYRSDFIESGYGYIEEKNKRCNKGGFAVQKSATCDCYQKKDDV